MLGWPRSFWGNQSTTCNSTPKVILQPCLKMYVPHKISPSKGREVYVSVPLGRTFTPGQSMSPRAPNFWGMSSRSCLARKKSPEARLMAQNSGRKTAAMGKMSVGTLPPTLKVPAFFIWCFGKTWLCMVNTFFLQMVLKMVDLSFHEGQPTGLQPTKGGAPVWRNS